MVSNHPLRGFPPSDESAEGYRQCNGTEYDYPSDMYLDALSDKRYLPGTDILTQDTLAER